MHKPSLTLAKKESLSSSTLCENTKAERGQVNIAVVGCGYWGPKLVRNLAQLREVKISTLCDLDPNRAYKVGSEYALDTRIETDYRAILGDPKIHGVVIATPAKSHFSIAQDMLNAHKHVFVEKPLAMSVKECNELICLAKKTNLTLMVGHVFRYNTAVQKIKEYIEQGFLGDLIYINTRRLNLGKIQTEINAMWSFAPHDISILLYWLGNEPLTVAAKGFSYLHPGIEDVVFLTMEFQGGVQAHSHLSWLNPKKVREIIIMGSKKTLVYDDTLSSGKIQIYDKSIIPEKDLSSEYEWSFAEFQTKVIDSNITIPSLPFSEPLQSECQHFVNCIHSNTSPLTGGQEGLSIVKVLEAAQKSLKQDGVPIKILKETLV